jgi:hypothetical protein
MSLGLFFCVPHPMPPSPSICPLIPSPCCCPCPSSLSLYQSTWPLLFVMWWWWLPSPPCHLPLLLFLVGVVLSLLLFSSLPCPSLLFLDAHGPSLLSYLADAWMQTDKFCGICVNCVESALVCMDPYRLSHAVALLKLFIGWISNLCGVHVDPCRICVILCGSAQNIWGSVKTSKFSEKKQVHMELNHPVVTRWL